jgi:Ankyrin repeat
MRASPSRDETYRLISYLIKARPESLEARSETGHTPLHVAFSLRSVKMARLLIKAGADQTACDGNLNNLLHTLLVPIDCASGPPTSYVWAERLSPQAPPNQLEELLELLHQDVVRKLWTQRNRDAVGGATPLHQWLAHHIASKPYRKGETADVLASILKYSEGAELEMFNATGETPLHDAVASQQILLVRQILEHNPQLLYWDNTVGRTPIEVAQDMFEESVLHVSKPTYNAVNMGAAHGRMWDLVRKVAAEHPGKRRALSLEEAAEAARRLAEFIRGTGTSGRGLTVRR